MTQRDPVELFIASYVKLLRAHGEVYPGATQDADELDAAYKAAEVASQQADEVSGQTTTDTDLTDSAPSA